MGREVDPREVAARELRHRLVGDPRRVEQDDLVALVDQRLEGLVQRLLAAGGDDHLVGVGVDAVAAELRRDRRLEFGDPVRGGVPRVSGVEGLLAGLDDVRRGVEVGLAD